MIQLKEKEIRGLTLGQFITIIFFLVSIISGGYAAYSKLSNDNNNLSKAIQDVKQDKVTQSLMNESLRLDVSANEKRITIIETKNGMKNGN